MFSVKYFVFFVAVVAASLRSVDAISEEEKAKFHESMLPILEECGKQHDTTKEDVLEAKKNHDIEALDSCFWACVFKENGMIDDKGIFDPEVALEKAKTFLSKEEDLAGIEEVGKECVSVNEEDVSDGEAGCDRAKLLLACFLKNKDKLF